MWFWLAMLHKAAYVFPPCFLSTEAPALVQVLQVLKLLCQRHTGTLSVQAAYLIVQHSESLRTVTGCMLKTAFLSKSMLCW